MIERATCLLLIAVIGEQIDERGDILLPLAATDLDHTYQAARQDGMQLGMELEWIAPYGDETFEVFVFSEVEAESQGGQ